MKKPALVLFTLLTIPLLFSTCKKGPGDPFISFRSRAARLEGWWQITKGKEQYTHNNSTNISTTIITDTAFTLSTPGSKATNQSGTISFIYHFAKQGTYSFMRVQKHSNITDSTSASGTWNFLSGGNGLKNKEGILLTQLTAANYSNGISQNSIYSNNNQGTVWVLTGLKNDYLVVDSHATESSPAYYDEAIHYEFTKQ